MKDLQKIKEFFSKPLGEVKKDEYGNHLEPQFKKGDKVTYLGNPGEITGVNKEMTGVYTYNVSYDKGNGKTKATNITNKNGTDLKLTEVVSESEEKYTVAGRPVTLNKGEKSNGTDWTVTFLTNSTIGRKGEEIPLSYVLSLIKPFPKGITMKEAKEETGVDMAKKQLDALGVKYEMSKTDKVRPFKVIYKPVNKSDKFYDEFEDIVDLFNLKGFVKTSMNEAEKEDAVDTITMDVPLFLRILEYSREDAQKDIDLHDVTDKAISLGKERGILSMEDYEEIVGTAEEIDENLIEANVPSNIAEFAKRKGVSSLVRKVAGWAEKVGARIAGGTAVGKNYSTLVLDLDYKQQGEIRIDTDNDTVTLYDEPVRSFGEFQRVFADGSDNNLEENVAPNHDGKAAPYGSGYKPLEERIAKALEQINEELCPAGKAYIKRRKAAGEKSSAYLSGRAVKVCKGQMSGRAKKK